MEKSVPPVPKSSENEVIFAVIGLYLLIASVMITVHYMQPPGQETVTSSTSPSHGEQTSAPAAKPANK